MVVPRSGKIFFKRTAAVCVRIDHELPKDVPVKVRRAVYLKVDRTQGDMPLRQGLFVQGTLDTGHADVLAVPLDAVRTDKPSPYVQVVENGRVAHKTVKPGARGEADQETWVAVDGLAPAAVVIRGYVGPLREGVAVKFTAATPSPSPQPSPASGRGSKAPSL